MLNSVTPADTPRIYEARAEYAGGRRVHAFGAGRTPAGDFGFVWGCVWGDDSSWKVQYLDLSRVADGVIRRDDRFGYLKLATDPKLEPRDFIRCSSWQGERRVEFYIERGCNLTTGALIPDEDW